VATGEHGGDHPLDDLVVADDHLADLVAQAGDIVAEGADLLVDVGERKDVVLHPQSMLCGLIRWK
jgi:hypothetical protein